MLKHHGYTLPAAALTSGLAAAAGKAAPPGLALVLAKGALAGSVAAGGLASASAKGLAVGKLKLGVAAALIIIGVGTTLWLQRSITGWQAPSRQPSPSQAAEDAGRTPGLLPPVGTAMEFVGIEPAPTVAQPPSTGPQSTNDLAEAIGVLASGTATAPMRPPFYGAPPRRLYSQPGSRIRIEGTNLSSRHAWQADSSVIEGFLDLEPTALERTRRAEVWARAEVYVPIHSLKSVDPAGRPNSEIIDEAWYAALKAVDDPGANVAFYLSALRRGPAATNAAEGVFDAKGELVLVGVTNPITLRVRILPLEREKLKISGTISLSWASEAVDPFSVLTDEGTFSPDTRVTVKFEWVVGPTNTPVAASQEGFVPLYLDLPTPRFKVPPRDLRLGSHVEPFPEMPRAVMWVPPGLTNVARAATVTSSDRNASPHALAKLVDGDKEGADTSIVYLRKGSQWVQLEFGARQEIFAIAIWHAHNAAKVYHDVVVQVADDPDFRANVRTLFNNDQDNTSGLGRGADLEYFENNEGKLIDAGGVQARVLRFYSRGSTESALNEYTEIEVYGRPGHDAEQLR